MNLTKHTLTNYMKIRLCTLQKGAKIETDSSKQKSVRVINNTSNNKIKDNDVSTHTHKDDLELTTGDSVREFMIDVTLVQRVINNSYSID